MCERLAPISPLDNQKTFGKLTSMENMTYGDLLSALNELSADQLEKQAMVAVGFSLSPVKQTALSCECTGPAVANLDENYPLIILND